nr:MAG TPA: hypothetical protein [Caudoviricetes sp.]
MKGFYTKKGKRVDIDICKCMDVLNESVLRFGADELHQLILLYHYFNLTLDSFFDLCEFIVTDPIVLKKQSKAYSITAQKQLLPYRGRYGEGFVFIEPRHKAHMANIYYYCFNRDWLEAKRKEWAENVD